MNHKENRLPEDKELTKKVLSWLEANDKNYSKNGYDIYVNECNRVRDIHNFPTTKPEYSYEVSPDNSQTTYLKPNVDVIGHVDISGCGDVPFNFNVVDGTFTYKSTDGASKSYLPLKCSYIICVDKPEKTTKPYLPNLFIGFTNIGWDSVGKFYILDKDGNKAYCDYENYVEEHNKLFLDKNREESILKKVKYYLDNKYSQVRRTGHRNKGILNNPRSYVYADLGTNVNYFSNKEKSSDKLISEDSNYGFIFSKITPANSRNIVAEFTDISNCPIKESDEYLAPFIENNLEICGDKKFITLKRGSLIATIEESILAEVETELQLKPKQQNDQ
jgi:hypothetical protein